MRLRFIPAGPLLIAIAFASVAALGALVLGTSADIVLRWTGWGALALVVLSAADLLYSRHAWRGAPPNLERALPDAFAIGVERRVRLQLSMQGALEWQCTLFDHVDASLITQGLPARLTLQPGKYVDVEYLVKPSRRGDVTFAPADVRVRSRWQLWEMLESLGSEQARRVYPDFAQVSRYAWLAGDRRLSEMGIKSFRQRGEGTDFKQLAEYRIGDAVRHIDWKATLRFDKPVVRQFQDERDQCVLLLIDCGRRMRADEGAGIGGSHFDQVLNAVMLLTYVALKHGDSVGALTFGTPPGAEQWFEPRKGAATLDALMSKLYDIEPTPTHSDYLTAARDLLSRHRKRSLVIVITNFRDEDSAELGQALSLLRSRHLVLTASLREQVVRQMTEQPVHHDTAIEIASAIHYEQQRRDAFNKLSAHDSLMVDAEPAKLSSELVNRYHAVKRAGMI